MDGFGFSPARLKELNRDYLASVQVRRREKWARGAYDIIIQALSG